MNRDRKNDMEVLLLEKWPVLASTSRVPTRRAMAEKSSPENLVFLRQ